MKTPELPFKKLPVLVDSDAGVTVAESTSILRYVGQLEAGMAWYGGKTLKEKTKIDEFLDNWQSSLHPNTVKLLQNQLMYKVRIFVNPTPGSVPPVEETETNCNYETFLKELLFQMVFRLKEPNKKLVDEAMKANKNHKKALSDYFIGSHKFIGGDQASIADILMVMTLHQTSVAGADNSDFTDYIDRVRDASDTAAFDELEQNVKSIPDILRSMKMIP